MGLKYYFTYIRRRATVQVTLHMCLGTHIYLHVLNFKNLVCSYTFLYTDFVGALVEVQTCVTHQQYVYMHVMSIHFTSLHYMYVW